MAQLLRRIARPSSERILLVTLFVVLFSLTSSILALIYQYRGYDHQDAINLGRQQLTQIIDAQRGLLDQLLTTRDRQLEMNLATDPAAQCSLVIGTLHRANYKLRNYIRLGIAVSTPEQIEAYGLQALDTRTTQAIELVKGRYLTELCSTLSVADVDNQASQRLADIQQLIDLSEVLKQQVHDYLVTNQRALDSVYTDSRFAILIAFLLQLLIFLIVNYYDIKSFRLGESDGS